MSVQLQRSNGDSMPLPVPAALPPGSAALAPGPSASLALEVLAGPPRLHFLPWLRVESFAQAEQDHVAWLCLRGELRVGGRPPEGLQLITVRGGVGSVWLPWSVEVSRGAAARRRRASLGLEVLFKLPPALVEDPHVEFRLRARGRQPIGLPNPVQPTVQMTAGKWVGLGAVAAALTATTLILTPARALAASGSAHPSKRAPVVQRAGRDISRTGATGAGGGKGSQAVEKSAGQPGRSVPAPPTLHPLPPLVIDNGGGAYSKSDIWVRRSPYPNPDAQLQLTRFADHANRATHPPEHLVRQYKHAASRYRLPWELIAAISYIETGYERQRPVSQVSHTRWVRLNRGAWSHNAESVGRMLRVVQHARVRMPASRNPSVKIARRLVADGAHTNVARAVFRSRHTRLYVQEVLTLAEQLTAREDILHQSPQRRLAAMMTMARLLNGIGYVWGGGHTGGSWIVQTGYDCSGFVSAVLHAGGYLQSVQSTQTLPGQQTLAKGVGRWVTIFDSTNAGKKRDHVIIDLNGQFWESGGTGQAGVSMVHRMQNVTMTYLQTFNVVLHPQGL